MRGKSGAEHSRKFRPKSRPRIQAQKMNTTTAGRHHFQPDWWPDSGLRMKTRNGSQKSNSCCFCFDQTQCMPHLVLMAAPPHLSSRHPNPPHPLPPQHPPHATSPCSTPLHSTPPHHTPPHPTWGLVAERLTMLHPTPLHHTPPHSTWGLLQGARKFGVVPLGTRKFVAKHRPVGLSVPPWSNVRRRPRERGHRHFAG
jgi:hypothetical protein